MKIISSFNRRTVYVGGLAEEVNPELLAAAFVPFGEIKECKIPLDRGQGGVQYAQEMHKGKGKKGKGKGKGGGKFGKMGHGGGGGGNIRDDGFGGGTALGGGTGYGKHRGFGFIEYYEEEDAQEAIDNMNESELFGRTLWVNNARAMDSNPQKWAKPVWADDFFYKRKLAEAGLEVDDEGLEAKRQKVE